MKQINKPKYRMKKILINSSSIDNFFLDLDARRQIRNGQVNQIKRHLLSDKHFSAPLVVNYINGKYKVVDGNHRVDAVKELIQEQNNFSIESWVAVYSELSDSEEREVYREWNSGVKQSATDFLKSHWESIPLRNEILRELPVSIYGGKNHIPVKSFVGHQISAKKEKKNFDGGYSAGVFQVVDDFKNLELRDIELLKEFSEMLERTIGKFHSKAPFYTTTSLGALYRIWYDNKDRLNSKKMEQMISKVFNIRDILLHDASKAGGRNAAINFYDAVLKKLNRGSVKFLNDEEAYDYREKKKKQEEIINLVRG